MAPPLDGAAPAMPLASSEGFAVWAESVCRVHGVSDRTISAMRVGIRESEIDGEVFRQGGVEDLELREGMRLPGLPAAGELLPDHAPRVLDGLAWRLLHAAAAGRGGLRASAGEIKAWVQRVLPGWDGVCDMVDFLGGAVCELLPSEAGLLCPRVWRHVPQANTFLPVECKPSAELVARLGRMVACLRSAAAQGRGLPDTESSVTVCVIGNTGAGKSTLLNAMLGEESLLPTNAMRACTAAIIEIVYNFDFSEHSSSYTAEIRFTPKEEWAAFVREAFQVLLKEGAGGDKDEEMLDGAEKEESLSKQLKSKLYAAYGKDIDLAAGPDSLLQKDGPINAKLGKVVTLGATCGKELRVKYEQYVDSANEASETAMWPIVQGVVLKGPWDLLCSGLRLVDAPGLQDDNSARDQVVRSYMRQADSLWLVSNIKRATNDKTTMDMMPAGFIEALKDKGVCGSLAYIATQTDDLIRSEVIQNLSDRLSEASTLLDCAVARNNFFKEEMPKKFSRERGAGDYADAIQGDSAGHGASRGDEKFEFMSFAVSAVDYQKIKGIRKGDGGPAVFLDEKATEIPRLQEYMLQCAPTLRKAGFKTGLALLDYLAEAKARAAREEEAAMVELELTKTYRSKFKQALDLVGIAERPLCCAEQMMLQQFWPTVPPFPVAFKLPTLIVNGAGFVGLPLSIEQTETLFRCGTAFSSDAGNRVSIIAGQDFKMDGLMQSVGVVPMQVLIALGMEKVHPQMLTVEVNSLLIAEGAAPSQAFSQVPQRQGSFGRLVVQLPSCYESGGHPSIMVTSKGRSQVLNWGGMQSVNGFFRLCTYSECEISFDNHGSRQGVPGRGLFLLCDLVVSNPGVVPSPLDQSDCRPILSKAIWGMLKGKREKLAVPLSVSVTGVPTLSQLNGLDRARISLLREQTQLDVGFVVLSKREASVNNTIFQATDVFDMDGKPFGFKFDFEFVRPDQIEEDEDRAGLSTAPRVCRDVILLRDAFEVVDVFQNVYPLSQHLFKRVVAVFWPKQRTFMHRFLACGFSHAMDSAERLVRARFASSKEVLQAIADSFITQAPYDSRMPLRALDLFAASGGQAPDAAALLIGSLAADGNAKDMVFTCDVCDALLKFMDVYGKEQGIKNSCAQLIGGLRPEQLNDHVLRLACDVLAPRGIVEVERALVESVLSSATPLETIPDGPFRKLIRCVLTQPRFEEYAEQALSRLQSFPVLSRVTYLEITFSAAFPSVERANEEAALRARNRHKEMLSGALRDSDGGSALDFFVRSKPFIDGIANLEDSSIAKAYVEIVLSSARVSLGTLNGTQSQEFKRIQLKEFVADLLLSSAAKDSVVEIVGTSLDGLGFSDAFRLYVDVRTEVNHRMSPNRRDLFTRRMFQMMAAKAGSYMGTKLAETTTALCKMIPSSAFGPEHALSLAKNLVSMYFARSANHPVATTLGFLEGMISCIATSCLGSQFQRELPELLRERMSANEFFDLFKGMASSTKASLRESLRSFAQCFDEETLKGLGSEQLAELAKTFCLHVPDNEQILQDFAKSLRHRAQQKTIINTLSRMFIVPAIRDATSESLLDLARLYLSELKRRPEHASSRQDLISSCIRDMEVRLSPSSPASASAAAAHSSRVWGGRATSASAANGASLATKAAAAPNTPVSSRHFAEFDTSATATATGGLFLLGQASPVPQTQGAAVQPPTALSQANAGAPAPLDAQAGGGAGRGAKRAALQQLQDDAHRQTRSQRRDGPDARGCSSNQGRASGQGVGGGVGVQPVQAPAAPQAAAKIVIDLTLGDD